MILSFNVKDNPDWETLQLQLEMLYRGDVRRVNVLGSNGQRRFTLTKDQSEPETFCLVTHSAIHDHSVRHFPLHQFGLLIAHLRVEFGRILEMMHRMDKYASLHKEATSRLIRKPHGPKVEIIPSENNDE